MPNIRAVALIVMEDLGNVQLHLSFHLSSKECR